MKNLYSKNEFLNLRQDELLNEGLIGKMFKSLWNSTVKLANKIKGSKEINVVYDKYKKLVDSTFAKMTNVETVGAVTPGTTEPVPAPAPASGTTNASFSFEGTDKLNEADIVPAPNQEKQNTEEQKKMVNLKPEQIKKLADTTTKRIEELKKQYDAEVTAIVTRLSKNPNYSSDKLTQFGVVMKNQFNSYLYDQWYNFYQKVGDQKKVLELTKTKKENEAIFKKSLDELNTKLGENTQQADVKTGGKYSYHSKSLNKDVTVEIVGKALGKDEKGKADADTSHNNMWKVRNNDTQKTFWLPASSFSKKVSVPADFKVGTIYKYTNKAGKIIDATVSEVKADGVHVTTTMNPNGFFIGKDSLANLKIS